jgi:hypothetical protein
MAGRAARTFTGNLPHAWVVAWRAWYRASCRSKGTLLKVATPLTAEQQRQMAFGPCWAWWGLSEPERDWWRQQDGIEATS